MSLGPTPSQGDVFRDTTEFCAPRVRADSIHALFHRECLALFPDELFADLFADVGRRSVPPLVVAVVMVLQRLDGLSDREAVERFTFDARWKYAAVGLPFDYPGFAHTVLVDMRARLARSDHPNRIFERTLEVARAAGLVGVRRVLDSTPLYDAVATMDTVTLVRSAIRGVLASRASGSQRSAPSSAATTTTAPAQARLRLGDADAGLTLIDALARDGRRPARGARGRTAPTPLAAGRHPACHGPRPGPRGGPRRPDPDRPAGGARPGHLHRRPRGPPRPQDRPPQLRRVQGPRRARPRRRARHRDRRHTRQRRRCVRGARPARPRARRPASRPSEPPLTVYGDSAYGAAPVLAALEGHGAISRCKVQPPSALPGHFSKDDFAIDLATRTVTCPAGSVARFNRHGAGSQARFRLGLRRLPAREPLHDLPRRSHDRDRTPRGAPRRWSSGDSRPRLAGRLPGHPAQGRTQDRPPDAPSPWRQTSARPGQAPRRRRLRAPRRRGQPRPARRPRPGPIRRTWVAASTRASRPHADGGRPSGDCPSSSPGSAHLGARALPSGVQNARLTPTS